MIPLVVTEDANGRIIDSGVRWSSFVDFLKLVAHAGVTLTVPTGAKHVILSSSVDFFIKYTDTVMTSAVYTTSSVQASGVCVGTAPELNPVLRTLTDVTGLSIISPSAGNMTLSWFG